jgi:hypothetical protein
MTAQCGQVRSFATSVQHAGKLPLPTWTKSTRGDEHLPERPLLASSAIGIKRLTTQA